MTVNGTVTVGGNFTATLPGFSQPGTLTVSGSNGAINATANTTGIVTAVGGVQEFDLSSIGLTDAGPDIVVNLRSTNAIVIGGLQAISLTENGSIGGQLRVRTANDITVTTGTVDYDLVQSAAIDIGNRQITVNAAQGTSQSAYLPPVTPFTGSADLALPGGRGSNITLTNAGNAFGTIVINDANDVNIVEAGNAALGNVTAYGNVNVSAGSITVNAGATVRGAASEDMVNLITFNAVNGIILNGAVTSMGATGSRRDILMTAQTGAITGAGLVTGNRLTSFSELNTGTLGGRINTDLNELNFTAGGAGAFFNEQDALTVAGSTTSGGNVDIVAGGSITVDVVGQTGIIADTTGNVTLTATAGAGSDIIINEQISSGSGNISASAHTDIRFEQNGFMQSAGNGTLNAVNGGVQNNRGDTTAMITLNNLTVNSVTGAGTGVNVGITTPVANGSLFTRINSFSANNTGAGDVVVFNSGGALRLGDVTVANGNLDVNNDALIFQAVGVGVLNINGDAYFTTLRNGTIGNAEFTSGADLNIDDTNVGGDFTVNSGGNNVNFVGDINVGNRFETNGVVVTSGGYVTEGFSGTTDYQTTGNNIYAGNNAYGYLVGNDYVITNAAATGNVAINLWNISSSGASMDDAVILNNNNVVGNNLRIVTQGIPAVFTTNAVNLTQNSALTVNGDLTVNSMAGSAAATGFTVGGVGPGTTGLNGGVGSDITLNLANLLNGLVTINNGRNVVIRDGQNLDLGNVTVAGGFGGVGGVDLNTRAGTTIRSAGTTVLIADENAGTAIGNGWMRIAGDIVAGNNNVALYAVGGPTAPAGYLPVPNQVEITGTIAGQSFSTISQWDAAFGLTAKYGQSYQAQINAPPGFGTSTDAILSLLYPAGAGYHGSPIIWYKQVLIPQNLQMISGMNVNDELDEILRPERDDIVLWLRAKRFQVRYSERYLQDIIFRSFNYDVNGVKIAMESDISKFFDPQSFFLMRSEGSANAPRARRSPTEVIY